MNAEISTREQVDLKAKLEQWKQMPCSHLVLIKFKGPGAVKGSRIILTGCRFPGDRIIESYRPDFRDALEQGAAILIDRGFTIVSFGELPGGWWIAVEELRRIREGVQP